MDIETDSSTSPNCFVCSQPISTESHPYNDIGWNDYGGIFDGLRIYHCNSCGFGFSAPELGQETVSNFYETQYRAQNSTFYIDFDDAGPYTGGIVRNDRSFVQLMLAREYCQFNSEDIFLDIGPGGGGGLGSAKALLPQPQLFGIELSQGAIEFYRKKYGAFTYQSLADFTRSGKKAKLLLMSHSLEHYRLSELTELFSELTRALDKGGVLVIEVPYADLRIHSKIRGVDTPHFLFFSKESLSLILEKFGFDVLFMNTCGEKFRTAEEIELAAKSIASRAKRYLKPTYNKLSMEFQNSLRWLVRFYKRVRISKPNPKHEVDNPDIHSYGGNRNCLRLVARRKDEE